MTKEVLGTHILLDMIGVDFNLLEDKEFAEKTIKEAINQSGATLLNFVYHKFSPQGLTCLGLLSESHMSLHTYPQHDGRVTWDFYFCGNCDPELAANHIIHSYNPREYKMQKIIREI